MKAEEGFEKLNDHYKGCIDPGLVLGDVEAIVGQFGLTVCCMLPTNNRSKVKIEFSEQDTSLFKEHRKIFIENDHLPIIKFRADGLIINVGWIEPAFLSYEHFKGFRFHNKLFIQPRGISPIAKYSIKAEEWQSIDTVPAVEILLEVKDAAGNIYQAIPIIKYVERHPLISPQPRFSGFWKVKNNCPGDGNPIAWRYLKDA